jgi:hypothetical protein
VSSERWEKKIRRDRRRRSLSDAVETLQPVEKAAIEPIATKNRAPKVPKAAYLAPNLGQERASREFFNRLLN